MYKCKNHVKNKSKYWLENRLDLLKSSKTDGIEISSKYTDETRVIQTFLFSPSITIEHPGSRHRLKKKKKTTYSLKSMYDNLSCVYGQVLQDHTNCNIFTSGQDYRRTNSTGACNRIMYKNILVEFVTARISYFKVVKLSNGVYYIKYYLIFSWLKIGKSS